MDSCLCENNQTILQMLRYEQTIGMHLNMDAIFTDETEYFVSNPQPQKGETVAVTIRTWAHNVDKVFLHITAKDGITNTIVASKHHTEGLFDFYQAVFVIECAVSYYVCIQKNEKTYYYNKRGLYPDVDHNFDFKMIPDFVTPTWAQGAVMYQIYVDRFCNGDKSNDVQNNEYTYLGKASRNISNWNQPVEVEDIANFYGGDLQGVINKLDYLQELGVDAIYFNPIYVSPSNHKYDIQDYDYVDPHIGVIVEDGGQPLSFDRFHNKFATMYMQRTTFLKNLEASNALLVKLIALAHDRGMKVILDGVFNHCGAFNKWLDREGFYAACGYPQGAYRDQNSPYVNYFHFYENAWPNNECYDCWWGHQNHPKLNFEASKELYDYILEVGRKWVSPPFYADGWRLDVAADLGFSKEMNHRFWRDFRQAVKSANPNAIILAEHYGDPADWLLGDQWDTVMNYDAFMEPITWFLTGMEKHSEAFKPEMLNNAIAFEGAMRYYMARHSNQSLQIAMNQLSNHDHSRFFTRTNMHVGRLHTVGAEAADKGLNKSVMMEAVVFQMTWPGAPTLYYGDEVGLCGWTDPDNRRTFPWGKEDYALLTLHKVAIAIHKQSDALKKGSLEYLYLNEGILAFGRFTKTEKMACVFNNNQTQQEIEVPVWKLGISGTETFRSLLCTKFEQFTTTQQAYLCEDGVLKLTMPPFSSVILQCQKH